MGPKLVETRFRFGLLPETRIWGQKTGQENSLWPPVGMKQKPEFLTAHVSGILPLSPPCV